MLEIILYGIWIALLVACGWVVGTYAARKNMPLWIALLAGIVGGAVIGAVMVGILNLI
jgi:hypothetical protein